MVTERQIILREAEDLGVHPPLAWGRLNSAGELNYCIATLHDGKCRCWSREAGEDAECFATRITRDLYERQCTGSHADVMVG